MKRPPVVDGALRPMPIAIAALVVLSIWCLKVFIQGMLFYQDLWDVSRYVALLVGSLAAAAAAAAVAEKLRRSGPDPTGVHGTLSGFSRFLLGLVVVGFLYCNVGPVRGIWHTAMRRFYTMGMARDLPPPPAQ